MEIITKKQTDKVTITLIGSFDYKARTQFKQAFREIPQNIPYILDFAKVNSIDSSGVGMLLLLREHAGVTQANITLLNCSPVVKKALHVAQFDQLFKIP